MKLLDDLRKDVVYAGRMSRGNWGFTLVAVLTIALGIGVNTTLFSVYNAIALRPLPVSQPDQVVRMKRWFENGSLGDTQYLFSYPEFVYTRDHNNVFSSVVAASGLTAVMGPDSEIFQAQFVSSNYFTSLGIGAQVGRALLPGEDRSAEENRVAVLSFPFWQRHFHGDPDIVGKTVRIKETALEVIGVAAETFTGTNVIPQSPDFWVPVSIAPQLVSGTDWLSDGRDPQFSILARLNPATTL